MRTAAILTVKSFDRAKSRLGDGVDRPALAAAMAADVLAALAEVRGLHATFVVSRRRPDQARLTWIADEREAGHVPAALLGIEAAVGAGAERVLLVPGDCPGLDPGEVAGLLEAPPGVTIVPDRHGSGTNALLLAPPDAIAPAFGPGSFARHAALVRAAGLVVRVAEPPSLLMDVDTPEDLDALRERLPAAAAPRTRGVLAGSPAC